MGGWPFNPAQIFSYYNKMTVEQLAFANLAVQSGENNIVKRSASGPSQLGGKRLTPAEFFNSRFRGAKTLTKPAFCSGQLDKRVAECQNAAAASMPLKVRKLPETGYRQGRVWSRTSVVRGASDGQMAVARETCWNPNTFKLDVCSGRRSGQRARMRPAGSGRAQPGPPPAVACGGPASPLRMLPEGTWG